MGGGRGLPVDILLFDLGRVLIEVDMERTHARWASLAGLPPGSIDLGSAARFMRSEAFRQHERGLLDDATFFDHLRRELGLSLSHDDMLDGWNAVLGDEVPGIREQILRVKGRLPLHVFSNTNAPHQAVWSVRHTDLLAQFDRIYVSHELGERKPDASAFLKIAADLRAEPARILFFDDVEENVSGARAAGLQAVHVTSTADIAAAIDRLGL